MSFLPEQVGVGTYGKVYKITEDGKSMAIKSMEDFKSKPLKYFEHMIELDVLFRIRSRYLVSGISIPEIGKYSFIKGASICLPLLSNIGAFLKAKTKIGDRINSMYSLARGVFDLHKNRILHLDIKPENCLYCEETGYLILGDYGLCYQCDNIDSGFATKRTYGVPPFRAKEHPWNDNAAMKIYNDKFDIWSLGILFIYLFLSLKEDVKIFNLSCYKEIQERFSSENTTMMIQQIREENVLLGDLINQMMNPVISSRISIEKVIVHRLFSLYRGEENLSSALLESDLQMKVDMKTFIILGITFLIDSFKGPYSSYYVRDFFLCLDLFMRSITACGNYTSDDECIIIAKLCIRIMLKYYYSSKQIPIELGASSIESLEHPLIRILKGRIRTTNYYDCANSLTDCRRWLNLMSCKQFEGFSYYFLLNYQPSTEVKENVACKAFFGFD